MSDSRSRFFARLAAIKRSRLALVLAVVVVVPLAAAGFFVAALGGAGDRASDIPAMVVNEDEMLPASEPGGTPVFAGRQLVTELTGDDNPGFNWTVSNAKDAKAALQSGEAYAVLTIPKDFSRTIMSLSSGEPARANVQLRTDDAHGYLAGSAAQSLGDAMAKSFGTELTSRYLAGFYENLAGMGGAFNGAADGAGKVAEGVGSLSTGLDALAGGAASSTSGAQQLASGVREYTNGVDSLSGGLAELDAQTAQLGQLGQGIGVYVGGTQQLSAALAQVNSGLQTAASYLDPNDPRTAGVLQAAGGLAQISQEFSAATAQGAPLAQGAAGLGQVHDGISQLSGGAAQLSNGSSGLRSGADALAGGLSQLTSGAEQSATGAKTLQNGAADLASGLKQGAEQTSQLSDVASDPSARADIVADPVGLTVKRDNPVASIAQAIGVVALPIALWLGAIAVFLFLRPVTREALASTASNGRLVFRSLLRGVLLAFAQVIPLVALLHLALDVPWATLPATLSFSVLLAVVFAALHFALTALMGRFGIVVSLILLVLQLAAVPGLLPGQIVASPFHVISMLLPLGHAVTGMQAVVAGQGAAAGAAAAVLLVWGFAALLVGYWRVARQRSALAVTLAST